MRSVLLCHVMLLNEGHYHFKIPVVVGHGTCDELSEGPDSRVYQCDDINFVTMSPRTTNQQASLKIMI